MTKEEIAAKKKLYREANKEKEQIRKKEYYLANKEHLLAKQKEWQFNNKDKVKAYHKNKMETDTLFKLKVNVRNLIGNSIRYNSFTKLSKTEFILGCNYQEFKEYIESKFEPWMSWDNRGLYNGEPNYGWDIDHIIPMNTALSDNDVLKLNHYSNLQPLCSYQNRIVKRALHNNKG